MPATSKPALLPPVEDKVLPYPDDFRSSQKGMRKATKALLRHRGDWLGLCHEHGRVLGAVSLAVIASHSHVEGGADSSFFAGGSLLTRLKQHEPCLRLAGASDIAQYRHPTHTRLFDYRSSSRTNQAGRCSR